MPIPDIQDQWRKELLEVVKKYAEELKLPDNDGKYPVDSTKWKFVNEVNNKINRFFDNAVRAACQRSGVTFASRIRHLEEENRSVREFLYSNPPLGGFPDSSLRLGVEFEVGGAYEDWGFVVERKGKTVASGRTLEQAMQKARVNLKEEFAKDQTAEKCHCGNAMMIYRQNKDGTRTPLCQEHFTTA